MRKSLNITLRRGTSNHVNLTDIKSINITKFEGRTLNVHMNFSDPTSISVVQDY